MEKESQKAIIIGKKGEILKKIGTAARLEMEKFFNARVFLELYVRVKKNWTSSDKMLQEFGLLKH
jgi:GTP-binding protein Era